MASAEPGPATRSAVVGMSTELGLASSVMPATYTTPKSARDRIYETTSASTRDYLRHRLSQCSAELLEACSEGRGPDPPSSDAAVPAKLAHFLDLRRRAAAVTRAGEPGITALLKAQDTELAALRKDVRESVSALQDAVDDARELCRTPPETSLSGRDRATALLRFSHHISYSSFAPHWFAMGQELGVFKPPAPQATEMGLSQLFAHPVQAAVAKGLVPSLPTEPAPTTDGPSGVLEKAREAEAEMIAAVAKQATEDAEAAARMAEDDEGADDFEDVDDDDAADVAQDDLLDLIGGDDDVSDDDEYDSVESDDSD